MSFTADSVIVDSANIRSTNSSAKSIEADVAPAASPRNEIETALPPPTAFTPLPSRTAITTPFAFNQGRPPSSLFSRGNLMSSRLSAGNKTPLGRPSTAVRGVGYGVHNRAETEEAFDRIFAQKAKQQGFGSTATIDSAKEVNPKMKYKNLESKISNLLEQSVTLVVRGNRSSTLTGNEVKGNDQTDTKTNYVEALNKAKEAFSLDRTLHRFRDQNGENPFHNFDLTYAVFFNLAERYEDNEMYVDALNTYSIMTKNKMFPNVNQLKMNMGNIYYKMGIFPKAIKMYRMALDSVPHNQKHLRLKITQNIGTLFVRMGQYADAAASYEFVMSEQADIKSGIHLILCYYAMGDVEKIKNTFRAIVDIQTPELDNELENENHLKLQQHENHQRGMQSGDVEENGNLEANEEIRRIFDALKNDELAIYCRKKKNSDQRDITMIVDLISPVIEENYNDGYNWCIEIIKTSNLAWMASELELNKALVYLRQNDVNQAIETLRLYEKKDESMAMNALINLIFIYLNLGDLENASQSMKQLNEVCSKKQFANHKRQSVMALINSSIIDIQRNDLATAKSKLITALELDPDNFEANYNLGLIARLENDFDLAETQFEKLKEQLMTPHSIQHMHVNYQLARIIESPMTILTTNDENDSAPNDMIIHRRRTMALQSYLQVLGISTNQIDSRLFEKVASLYEQFNEHQEANQYYNEAYRINPSDILIATSIGSYFIKLQAIEKAIYYYERAVLADPNDPSLMLRIASCLRHSIMPPKNYLAIFEKIYSRFPNNLMCIRALMHVTKSLGMSDLYDKYSMEYTRLNKIKMETDRQNSSKSSSARSNQRRLNNNSSASTSKTENDSRKYNIPKNSSPEHQDSDDVHHIDPLGPPPERPRTGVFGKPSQNRDSGDDDDEISTESLLPV